MKDIAKNAPRAPKSQLVNAGANAKAAPSSALAMFVAGDIKGGEAAHNYRMSVVATAIREALKGNSRALVEAAELSKGKAKKPRAYAAGFAAVGIPARVQYAGKLDAPENAAVRERINQLCASLEFEFESAFLTVFTAPAEPKAPKAKKTTEADDTSDTDTAPVQAGSAESAVVPAAAVAVDDLVQTVVAAVTGGLVSATDLAALEAAIAQYRAGAVILAAMDTAPATTEA